MFCLTAMSRAKVALFVLAFAGATFLASTACAQAIYNGSQNTIISGITNGGQTPYGLAVDSSGNVWVSGQGYPNSYIVKYPKSNGYQYTGQFIDSDATYGGRGTPESSALSIAFDSHNILYIPAAAANAVYEYFPGESGLYNAVLNVFPNGVGVGLDGNLYVADTDDTAVVIVPLPINLNNSNNSISVPCGVSSVAADAAGNFYIPCGSRVLEYVNQGNGNYAESVVTSSLSNAGYPQFGIAVDRNGIVYVCDSYNNRVLRETPKPGGGYAESQLPWSYNNPYGITLDNQGNLYVSDSYNGKVDEISFVPSSFSQQTVGTASGSQSYSFTIFAGTTVSQIAAVSSGQTGQDFSSTATCTPQTFSSNTNCTVNVTFTPKAPGLRKGAIVFYDGNGNSLLSLPISGTGSAPQIALNGNLSSSNLALPASTTTNSVAIDNAGNLFVATHSTNQANFPTVAGNIVEYPASGASYGTPVTVATLNYPFDLAIAPNGDLVVSAITTSDGSAIYDVPRTSTGYGTPVALTSSGQRPFGVAVDSLGDIFYIQSGTLFKMQKSINTYGSPIQIATGLTIGGGLAVDAANNVYVPILPSGTTNQNESVVIEYTAASNYQTSNTVATGLTLPSHIAVEPNGNLLIQNGSVQVIPATSSGFGPPVTAATPATDSYGFAVDRAGNIVVNNEENNLLQIFRRGASSLAFPSTAEGSTSSPQAATIENFGNQPLNFSEVTFPTSFPEASGESTDCSSSTQLAAGAMCTLTFQFTPSVALTGTETIASLNGTGSVTTNSLNGSDVVNSVSLSGTETKPVPAVSLAATSTQLFYGQAVNLTATVTGGEGLATTAPSGVVGFFLGSTSLGAVTLTGSGETGTASLTVAAGKLPAGASSFTVEYTGDTVYGGKLSQPLTVNVAQDGTTAALTLTPSTVTPSTAVTLTATVANPNSAFVPGGTVTFNYTGASAPLGAVLNTATLNNGTASIHQLLPAGEGVVSVTYAGNANFTGSTSTLVPVNVAQLTPIVTLTAPSGNVSLGTSVYLKATVTSPATGYTPTGSVTIFADGQAAGACTLSSGFCGITTSSLLAGVETLYAVYSGDANFNSAYSTLSSFSVVPDTPRISVSLTSGTIAYGGSVSMTASVATTDGTTAATGNFTFEVDGVAYGSPVSLSGGSATLALTGIGAGYHHLQAMYSGDLNYFSGSSGLIYLTVSKQTPTVSLSDSNPFPSVTNPAVLNVTVAGTSGTPTGTVIFYSGPTRVGSATLSAGTGVLTLPLAAGNYNLTATYSGDSNFVTATTAFPLPLRVGQGQIGISVSASSSTAAVGQYVAIKIALQGYNPSYPPTGSIILFDNGPELATLPIISSVAGESVLLPVGSNAIEAIYTGDPNYDGGNANPIYVNVSQAATTLSVSATPNPDVLGDSFTVTSRVSSTATGVSPTGIVTFSYGGNPIGTGTVTAGLATFTTNALPVGTAVLSAQYSGDSNFLPSNSPSPSITVGKAKPALVLTSSATSSTQGAAITLTATAPVVTVGASAVPPTGTVTFYNGSASIGSASFTSNGTARLAVTTLPVGTDSVHAYYTGDGNYNAVESLPVSITVTASKPSSAAGSED